MTEIGVGELMASERLAAALERHAELLETELAGREEADSVRSEVRRQLDAHFYDRDQKVKGLLGVVLIIAFAVALLARTVAQLEDKVWELP